MANKSLGYTISAIGIIIMIISYPVIRKPIGIASLGLSDSIVMIIGLAIVLIGIILAFSKSSGKQEEEVPIFEGEGKNRRVVGYKRMNKK